jgi:hypothetical protein
MTDREKSQTASGAFAQCAQSALAHIPAETHHLTDKDAQLHMKEDPASGNVYTVGQLESGETVVAAYEDNIMRAQHRNVVLRSDWPELIDNDPQAGQQLIDQVMDLRARLDTCLGHDSADSPQTALKNVQPSSLGPKNR